MKVHQHGGLHSCKSVVLFALQIIKAPPAVGTSSTAMLQFEANKPGTIFSCQLTNQGKNALACLCHHARVCSKPIPSRCGHCQNTAVYFHTHISKFLGATATWWLPVRLGNKPNEFCFGRCLLYIIEWSTSCAGNATAGDVHPVPCSSPAVRINLPDGRYSFSLAAADRLGNTAATSLVSFLIDTAPPVISGVAFPFATRNTSVSVSFNATDSGSGINRTECRCLPSRCPQQMSS